MNTQLGDIGIPYDIPGEIRGRREAIVFSVVPLIKYLASTYHDPNHLFLDREEIYGELMLVLARAFERYIDREDEELTRIIRTMFRYHINSLLRKKYRIEKVVWETVSIEEDGLVRLLSSDLCCNPAKRLGLDRFVLGLSPLARQMVIMLVAPTDELHQHWVEYIEANKRKGRGASGIPQAVLSRAMGVPISQIRKAVQEIRGKLQEGDDDDMMDLSQYDFAGTKLTWQDVKVKIKDKDIPVPYIRWRYDDLEAQAKFRGIAVLGKRSGQLVRDLREDDKQNGIPSDTGLGMIPELNEFYPPAPEIDEDVEIEDGDVEVPSKESEEEETPTESVKEGPNRPGLSVELDSEESTVKQKPVNEQEGSSVKDDRSHKENLEEEVSGEQGEAGKSEPAPAAEGNEPDSEDAVPPSEKKVAEDEEPESAPEHPLSTILQGLPADKAIIVTRIDEDNWRFRVVSKELVDHIEEQTPTPKLVKPEPTEEPAESEKDEEVASPDKQQPLVKGSPQWNKVVYTPEYLARKAELDAMTEDEAFAYADKHSIIWIGGQNECVEAIIRHEKVKQYNVGFETAEQRAELLKNADAK